ncbi:hypothetical protein [Neptunicella sp. SCSIO 80796]|uniref:hypothetical protein n=1 Tax=Neptunicella plasticusilytica TaxID=3117012 RepID=UPI003A4E1A7E
MQQFIKATVLLLLPLAMCGCNTLMFSSNDKICFSDEGETYACQNKAAQSTHDPLKTMPVSGSQQVANRFQTPDHFVSLNEYVKQLAVNLHDQLGEQKISQPVLISELNSALPVSAESSRLIQQLKVMLTTELAKMGLPVYGSDIASAYRHESTVGYELQTSLLSYRDAIRIDISLVDLHNQASVSSASTEVPAFIYAKL